MYEKNFFLIGKRLEQTVAMFLLKVAETAGLDLPSFFHPSTSSVPVSVNDYGAQESILPTYVAWRESIPGLLKRSTNTGSVNILLYLLHFSGTN
jgi:hypothetical protein